MKIKANTVQPPPQYIEKKKADKIQEILKLVKELVDDKENNSHMNNNNNISQTGNNSSFSKSNNSKINTNLNSSNNSASSLASMHANALISDFKNVLHRLVEVPKIKVEPKPTLQTSHITKCFIGLPDKNYFFTKYKINNSGSNFNNMTTHIYKKNDFLFQKVVNDDNCGYRALALQLYGNEEFYSDIRNQIYTYLALNQEKIPEQNFEVNDIIVTNAQYIQNVKNNNFFMGDLEISVIHLIYNATVLVFQLKELEEDITLLSIKGDLFDPNKILITLCIVNDDHFCAIYEKTRQEQNVVNKIYGPNSLRFIDNRITANLIKDDNTKIEIDYVNDNKIFKYKDIVIYLNSRTGKASDGIYPLSISNIQDRIQRRNKKREFRKALKNYLIDPTTKRLKLKFVDSTSVPKVVNEYFIAYQIEKLKLVKKIHNLQMHQGNKSLYDLVVKKNHYWWVGIYPDIKTYTTYCDICKHTVRVVKRGRPRKNKDKENSIIYSYS